MLAAVAVVPSLTLLLSAGAAARFPPFALVDATTFDPQHPGAYEAILDVHLIFAIVFVGAYAGVVGAIREREAWPHRAMLGSHGLRRIQSFVAISAVVLPGLILASASGAGIALALAVTRGWPAWEAMTAGTVGDVAGLVVRAWWALLPFAAIAFLTGVATRRRLGGLVAVAAVVLIEQLASAVVTPNPPGWTPFANAAALVSASTRTEILDAVAIAGAYVAASLGIAVTLGMDARVRVPRRAQR